MGPVYGVDWGIPRVHGRIQINNTDDPVDAELKNGALASIVFK